MINFESNYQSIKVAAKCGEKIVNSVECGNEVQAFTKGQRVSYTDKSPIKFYNGVIMDIYNENGYFYYIVSYQGANGFVSRTFRQCDIEIDYLCENKATTRQKTAYNGKVYTYTVNASNDVITINGVSFSVVQDFVFAIRVQKTQIKAVDGALGLLKTLLTFGGDNWETKILNGCKPIK